ncbi:biotin/lipoyl-containing protein [Kitasatospora sp. NPDC101235]|uniref:biotin/lipoyl-containing protein n=1 Tax=Kitasatospora sp. NPDC101235 TaxID=3364101 RepID=UPI00380F3AEA
MAPGKRGRPWSRIRSDSPEGEELALFLRARVEDSGKTLSELGGEIGWSRSQVSHYVGGAVPDEGFVTALVRATSSAELRARHQAEALRLLERARRPADRRTPRQDAALPDPLPRQAKQLEIADRLTRSQERQAELERTVGNSAKVVMVLLGMLHTLNAQLEVLREEHERLLAQRAGAGAVEETEVRARRAVQQRRRAQADLRRAEDKRRQAEALVQRVQQEVRELTDELNRLRAAGSTGLDSRAPAVYGLPEQAGPQEYDPVADDIDQALAHAEQVIDADADVLDRIADEMLEPPSEPGSPQSGDGPAVDQDGLPPRARSRPSPVRSFFRLPRGPNPRYGNSFIGQVTVKNWHYRVGEEVPSGATLLAVATGIGAIRIPSPWTGTLAEIYAEEGTAVEPGDVLAGFELPHTDRGPAVDQGGLPPIPDRAPIVPDKSTDNPATSASRIVPVVLPPLGQEATEAKVTRWLALPGDTVEEGEPILEVETDTAACEIPSPVTGIVEAVELGENETAPIGATLAWIHARARSRPSPVRSFFRLPRGPGPRYGNSFIGQVTVKNWHYRVGEEVPSGATLLAVATGIGAIRIPSPWTGTLAEIYAEEGTAVEAGDVLAGFELPHTDRGPNLVKTLFLLPRPPALPGEKGPVGYGSRRTPRVTVTGWQYQVGEEVPAGAVLLTVTTGIDRIRIPNPRAGILTEISAREGTTVEIGDVLAELEHHLDPKP